MKRLISGVLMTVMLVGMFGFVVVFKESAMVTTMLKYLYKLNNCIYYTLTYKKI
jgi:hypothetical protein